MIKPVFLLFLLFLHLSNGTFAQVNLVPNGSFEQFESCPQGIADLTVKNWYSPTFGSSDYYNTCGDLSANVPNNYTGKQEAHSGQAYCGIGSAFEAPNSGYREYLQIILDSELEESKIYVFNCYASLAEISKYCTTDIGIALSLNQIGGLFASSIPTEAFTMGNNPFFCDTSIWTEISIFYCAKGGERYLTIGVFESDQSAKISICNSLNTGGLAYYYIDDVALNLCDFHHIPNCFSPNNDGVNDFWSFSIPSGFDVTVINRWGDVVHKGSSIDDFYKWNGSTIQGNECNEGTYFYIISKNDIRKTGFFQLIR